MAKNTRWAAAAVALCLALFAACKPASSAASTASKPPEAPKSAELQLQPPGEGAPVVTVETTKGTFKVVLFPDLAPLACRNFLDLCKSGYYNNLVFHRILKDFLIQSGDPTGSGTGGESIYKKPFPSEYTDKLRHFRGALAMAAAEPGKNTSQFYIVTAPPSAISAEMSAKMKEQGWRQGVLDAYAAVGGAPYLDYQYTVFGQVYEGMATVDKIATTAADKEGKPKEEVKILKITIGSYTAVKK